MLIYELRIYTNCIISNSYIRKKFVIRYIRMCPIRYWGRAKRATYMNATPIVHITMVKIIITDTKSQTILITVFFFILYYDANTLINANLRITNMY